MWSVGVVWLELLLGTPHVFQISPRAAALLNQRLQTDNKDEVSPARGLRQVSQSDQLYMVAHSGHMSNVGSHDFERVDYYIRVALQAALLGAQHHTCCCQEQGVHTVLPLCASVSICRCGARPHMNSAHLFAA